jgi:hypothetical protein
VIDNFNDPDDLGFWLAMLILFLMAFLAIGAIAIWWHHDTRQQSLKDPRYYLQRRKGKKPLTRKQTLPVRNLRYPDVSYE